MSLKDPVTKGSLGNQGGQVHSDVFNRHLRLLSWLHLPHTYLHLHPALLMTANPVKSIEVIITECDVLLSLLSTGVLSILMPSVKPFIKILTEAEIYIAQSIYLAQGTSMSDHQQNTHMQVHPHMHMHAHTPSTSPDTC